MEVQSLAAMNTDEHSGTSKLPQILSDSPKSKSNSDSKGSASNMNSQYENLRPDVGMSPIVSLNVARAVAYQRPRISRSKLLTKIFSLKSKRAADSESSHGEGIVEHHISTVRIYSLLCLKTDCLVLVTASTWCSIDTIMFHSIISFPPAFVYSTRTVRVRAHC